MSFDTYYVSSHNICACRFSILDTLFKPTASLMTIIEENPQPMLIVQLSLITHMKNPKVDTSFAIQIMTSKQKDFWKKQEYVSLPLTQIPENVMFSIPLHVTYDTFVKDLESFFLQVCPNLSPAAAFNYCR